MPLLTAQEAKDYFDMHASENWDKTKQDLLHSERINFNDETQPLSGPKVLDALVKYRDIIDYKLYRQAIEKIFPPNHYNLITTIEGKKDTNRWGLFFKARWFEFTVTRREPGNEKNSCRIKINAPGSRTLTSDIDTSVMTWVKGDANVLFAEAEKRVREGGLDYAGNVTSAVIDYFYRANEEEFGKTSSQHRDSNAYADLAEDEVEREEYPKLYQDRRNPLIDEKNRLLLPNEWQKVQAAFEQQKHRLELAASLFSLRAVLDNEEWLSFGKEVEKQVENRKFTVDKTKREAYLSRTKADIKAVFEETKKLWEKHSAELAAKKAALKMGEDGYLPAPESEDEIKNVEIAALNRLYVHYLDKRNKVSGDIKAHQEHIKHALEQTKELALKVKEANKKCDELKTSIESTPHAARKAVEKAAKKAENKSAVLAIQLEEQRIKLKEEYEKLDRLMLEKLSLRYQAHTFAYEAYVCRSAVHHVVGFQKEGSTRLPSFSEHTLLCSALQQIGFKIQHGQELEKSLSHIYSNNARLVRGGVAYKTAKYGQRLHQLLFNNKPVTDEDIEEAYHTLEESGLGILVNLKSSIRKNAFKVFTAEELTYLNCETRILSLKTDETLSETQRYERAFAYLQEWGGEEQPSKPLQALLLNVASKLMSIIYLSKFTRQHRLWGEPKQEEASSASLVAPPPSYTPLLQASTQMPTVPFAAPSQASKNQARFVKHEAGTIDYAPSSQDETGYTEFLEGTSKNIRIGSNAIPK